MTDTASAQSADPVSQLPDLVATSEARAAALALASGGQLRRPDSPDAPAGAAPEPGAPPAAARAHSPLIDGPPAEARAAAACAEKIRVAFSEIARHIHLAEQIVPRQLGALAAAGEHAPVDFDQAAAADFLSQASALLDAFKPRA